MQPITNGKTKRGLDTRRQSIFGTLRLGILLTAEIAASTGVAFSQEWIRQVGSTDFDIGSGVSADSQGNVFLSGSTSGNLTRPVAGQFDAFLARYDSSGNSLWTRQFGTTGIDRSTDVSVDGFGNVYVSGVTTGNLGGPSSGFVDAFVSKYDYDGDLLWTGQLGTPALEGTTGVSADGLGNVYISGITEGNLEGSSAGRSDAFISKFGSEGGLLWTRQFGTGVDDITGGVSADGLGNVYVSGFTFGTFSPPSDEIFLKKYDGDGNLIWERSLGSDDPDRSMGVSADGLGNVYISGVTFGLLGDSNAGAPDAFVTKYDDEGNLLWTRQFGTETDDRGLDLSADGLGNVFVSGFTFGSLGGPNVGQTDAFVSKLDALGNIIWSRQLGTSEFDDDTGVSADGQGNVYISGSTGGDLGGPSNGSQDAFLARVVPEPTSLTVAILVALLSVSHRVQRRGSQ